jgi:hypothetical protein
MLRYSLGQRVFLYDTYMKYEFARKWRRKFVRKFRDERTPSRQTIHTLLNTTIGLLIDKKKTRRVFTEKSDDIRVRLEHTPRKSLKCLSQETGVSKFSAVFVRSNSGIVYSILTRGVDVCVWLFCICDVLCVFSNPATGWFPVQGVLPTAYRLMFFFNY